MTDGGGAAAAPQKDFLGHPRGLVILFFTEMWERFSFYGMRSLLVLYLTQHFLFGQGEAQGIYAAYAALVYLMPVIGGIIADKYLGSRKAVTIGALLLVAGHFTMAFEGSGSREILQVGGAEYAVAAEGRGDDRQLFIIDGDERRPITIDPEGIRLASAADESLPLAPSEAPASTVEAVTTAVPGAVAPSAVAPAAPRAGFPAFVPDGGYEIRTEVDMPGQGVLFLALALIVIGVGFLKPNISTVVGALYEQGDPRRDGGFTIFYVGINIGAFVSSGLCAWLGIRYGWAYGFGLAGIGMLLGLMVFLLGQKWLEGRAEPPNPERLKQSRVVGIPLEAALYIGGLIAIIPIWLLLQQHVIVETALTWLVPAIFVAMLGYSTFVLKGVERGRMLVALILTIFSVLFWALFEQAGSSLTLFANSFTAMPGWFNAGMTQTFNPGVIIVMGPIFAAMWVFLARRNIEPNTPVKFSLGLVLLGLGFLVLVWAVNTQAGEDFRVPLIWLFMTYFLHTLGELCLSPVGLSMITKLSVARVVGLMMGVWFMASALGHTVAGLIAQRTSADTIGGVLTDRPAALAGYAEVYSQIGIASVGVGLVLLVLSPVLKKMMAGIH